MATPRCLSQLRKAITPYHSGSLRTEVPPQQLRIANAGRTIWDYFPLSWGQLTTGEVTAATALLRVMVLRDAPPQELAILFSPEITQVVQDGAKLRARLPGFLERRRAFLEEHAGCPLIAPLRGLVFH
jgi:hypothetical protein